MSEPKTISPLLDGFKLGAPIRDQNGIVCRPAIKENSNKKFIVKTISVPANQAQLDALLLAGAYKDPADAMEYFRRKGEDILKEAEHLKVLSKLEGFLPYDGWQMEPITRHRLGYEIYLVSSYKRSLEKYMAKNAFTHLEAVNLGLDLCSALSVCRQSGYLYVDLKPSNVYVSEKKEYRIGDLGFLSLDALRYASLPEQYYSPYTPPELLDPMASMNLTADTYAVGMILYRLYNDGQLPFRGLAPEHPISPPLHADYELAEIIMKAISPDPAQRWTDPKELGKAIAGYMQRNSVNDIPITPFIPLDVVPEQVSSTSDKKRKDTEKTVTEENVTDTAMPADQEPASETVSDADESKAAEGSKTIPEHSDVPVETEEPPVAADAPEIPDDPQIMDAPDIAEDTVSLEQVSEELPSEPEQPLEENTTAPSEERIQDPAENETSQEKPKPEISEDVAKIITKADDLIAYQIPDGVLYPAEPEEDPFAFVLDDSDILDDTMYDDPMTEENSSEDQPETKKSTKHFADNSKGRKVRKFFGGLFGTLLVGAACVGGYWYYQNIYLQTVDALTVSSTQDQITVLIDTSVDESRLLVRCSDSAGTTLTESVKGGKATFLNLEPSTQYDIEVDVNGFHKLTGDTTAVFKTESATRILTFDAIAGAEQGSAILEFTVEGTEPDFWNIRYSAENEDERRETVTSHTATISGLTVGKVYTFTLDGGKDFDVSGNKQMQYVASKLILAENISAFSDNGTDVLIKWNSPGDVVVENWTVRCYDGYGYEELYTVTDQQIQLKDLSPDIDYTVDITAAGMTAPATISLSAESLNISDFHGEESKKTALKLAWDFTGTPPADGWILTYSIDGSGSNTLECKKAEATISPLIPGATYRFTVQTADGNTVFNNRHSYTTQEAEVFQDNGVKHENLSFELVKTPAEEGWTFETLEAPDLTDTFAPGDGASLVIKSSSSFYMAGYETKVLFVLRNAYGNVLTDLVTEETHSWKNIWQAGDPLIGELNIPALPSLPGDYVLELYFNGKLVTEQNFHIV